MEFGDAANFVVQVLEIIGILLIVGIGWLLMKLVLKSRKRKEEIDDLEKDH